MLQTVSQPEQYSSQRTTTRPQKAITTISCSICSAIYTASPIYQDMLQTHPNAMDAAFMSACHFCFRCRRPSCPECWDSINGICGACVQEANLPFRSEASPLAGTIFPAKRQTSTQALESSNRLPLICIRSGSIRPRTTRTTGPFKSVTLEPLQREESAVDVVEVDSMLTLTDIRPDSGQVDIDILPTPASPEVETPTAKKAIRKRKGKKKLEAVTKHIDEVSQPDKTKQSKKTKKNEQAEKKEKVQQNKKEKKSARRRPHIVERIFTNMTLFLLIVVILIIVLAEVSPQANAAILQVVHIDIHAEIAYLFHLLGSAQSAK